MTTITAEAFAMNVERYLKQAIKHGLRVITPEGHMLLVEASEPLTANGMTEAEELALLKAYRQLPQFADSEIQLVLTSQIPYEWRETFQKFL